MTESNYETVAETDMKKTFEVNELAVYPAHGVGIIEKIESRKISGKKQDFYVMKIMENNIKIMVPVDNIENIGIRSVIDPLYVPEVYKVLVNTDDFYIDRQTWNRRYKDYMDKLRAGSIIGVAEVFRDLYILRMTKTLSFGERKLFDIANGLLIKELAIAKNTDEDTILSEIEELFADLPIEEIKQENASGNNSNNHRKEANAA